MDRIHTSRPLPLPPFYSSTPIPPFFSSSPPSSFFSSPSLLSSLPAPPPSFFSNPLPSFSFSPQERDTACDTLCTVQDRDTACSILCTVQETNTTVIYYVLYRSWIQRVIYYVLYMIWIQRVLYFVLYRKGIQRVLYYLCTDRREYTACKIVCIVHCVQARDKAWNKYIMYCTGEGYNVLIYYVLYRRRIQRVNILRTVQERDTAC